MTYFIFVNFLALYLIMTIPFKKKFGMRPNLRQKFLLTIVLAGYSNFCLIVSIGLEMIVKLFLHAPY